MGSVLVFDFLSHENMHHPFNEGYLRMLTAAFPNEAVIFHARAGHIAALSSRFTAADGVEFRSVPPFAVPFGLSPYNPLGGRIAAWRCWRTIKQAAMDRPPRLVSVLGADANLLSVLRRVWGRSEAVLHLVLHNHLGVGMRWRSRNPLIRRFDLISGLQRPLPPNVRLMALELGIREATIRAIPETANSIETLEHPVLQSEWCTTGTEPRGDQKIRIAFLGFASLDKGFGHFTSWARENQNPDLEFHAIGLASKEKIDFRGLIQSPSPRSLTRKEYTAALKVCDVVCLPLAPAIYNYIASGTIIDAIAGLKPIFSVRNAPLSAMEVKYGSFGYLAEDLEELRRAVLNFNRAGLETQWNTWLDTLHRMRAARLPEALAAGYAAAVMGLEKQLGNKCARLGSLPGSRKSSREAKR